MIKRKKLMAMTVVICCFLFSVTALAATRDSKGWNVYNSSGTVYANVGVTYVSDTFAGKARLTYTARVLGQDASAIIKDNAANIQIYGDVTSWEAGGDFYNGHNFEGSKKTKDTNSYVRVVVTIDGRSDTQYVYLD